MKTLVGLVEQSRFFYQEFDDFDEKAAKKHLRGAVLEPLTYLKALLTESEDWSKESIHGMIEQGAGHFDIKMGKIAHGFPDGPFKTI